MVFSILQNCEIITTIYYNFRIFGAFKKNPIPLSNHLPQSLPICDSCLSLLAFHRLDTLRELFCRISLTLGECFLMIRLKLYSFDSDVS